MKSNWVSFSSSFRFLSIPFNFLSVFSCHFLCASFMNRNEKLAQCEYRPPYGRNTAWIRGAYQCLCRPGFYSQEHREGFNGTFMEVAYKDYRDNISRHYEHMYRCNKCANGCITCTSPAPCLATYNWAFRIGVLTISIICAGCTIVLSCYLYHHRKVKVFKVASPIFLTITLCGCGIMYLEVSVSLFISFTSLMFYDNFIFPVVVFCLLYAHMYLCIFPRHHRLHSNRTSFLGRNLSSYLMMMMGFFMQTGCRKYTYKPDDTHKI